MKKLTAVRLDGDVIQRIAEMAAREGRTLSGQIVRLLGLGLEAAAGSVALVPSVERKNVVIKPRSAGLTAIVEEAAKVKPRRAEVFMMTCKRCDGIVVREGNWWKCGTCRKQLEEREVIEHLTTCKCWRCQQERVKQCGSATTAV
jgi:hypothetical protein